MSLYRALYTYLGGVAGVSALVGSGSDARIYPVVSPEGAAFPRISMVRVGDTHPDTTLASSGIVHVRMQVNCWDDDFDGASDLGDAVRNALHGFSGRMGDDSLDVRYVTVTTRRETYDAPHDGSMVGVYRSIIELSITHAISVPTF